MMRQVLRLRISRSQAQAAPIDRRQWPIAHFGQFNQQRARHCGQFDMKEQFMSRTPRPRTISLHALIVLALLAIAPGAGFAQSGSDGIPKNASAKSYGSGWTCDRGYRAINGGCAAVLVPANAYPIDTSYGRGWECKRGYREVDETCAAIKVPLNGYLEAPGDGWACDRGHREVNGTCATIKVPPNGYLVDASYGAGWKCDRGYRAAGDNCVAIKVPENGYFVESSYGPGWKCDRGYRAANDACVAVKVPENGYFVDASYGPGWRCRRGHRANNGACIALKLPDNAHIDYSGNDWECDKPYRNQRDKCVQP
jgi:hypothetical protein